MGFLADCHPLSAALCLLLPAGIAMFSMDPLLLALALSGGLCACLMADIRSGYGWSLLLFLLMAAINPLTYHNGQTPLLVVNGNPITLEATLYGLAAAGMVTAVLLWFRVFSRLMTSDRLLCLLGGLSPRLALLLSLTLRYVPLFTSQAKKIKQSQQALGLYKEDNIVDGFRGGLHIFSVMVTWALENGIITADSMAARGYGLGRRTQFSLFRFTLQDAALVSCSLLFALLTLWGLHGRTVCYYPAFGFPAVTGRALVGYAAYGLLVLLPMLHTGKEALQWHCSRWKT